METEEIKKLKKLAINVRRDCLKTQQIAGSGHLGGAFSAVEIMVYLYFKQMNIDSSNYLKEDRDIFILSKGHASIAYYSVLARRGFFPLEELQTYRQIDSRLQGHPHIDDAPGIECSTGSLGQGLSFGLGLALGYNRKTFNNKIYVMLGDGEMEEGQVWEALLLQSFLKLDNIIIVIDYNKLQLDDYIERITSLHHLSEKLTAFGFNTIEIDGHDFKQIAKGFAAIQKGQANIIIANTIKGKGISFMENSIPWHSQKANQDEYQQALQELAKQEAQLNE